MSAAVPPDVPDAAGNAGPSGPLSVRVSQQECPSPHSFQNKLGRVAWAIVAAVCFRLSPRICYGWRRFWLRLFGAQIGINARIAPTARIWAPWNLTVGTEVSIAHEAEVYCVAPISIGDHATVSQGAMLCAATHDIADPHMRLVMKPIHVAAQAWVCARAFVGPGVTVGEGAVVGACAVTMRDVEPWAVVIGNPARFLKRRVLHTDSQ